MENANNTATVEIPAEVMAKVNAMNLLSKKGQFMSFETLRDCKTKKSFSGKITKKTKFVVKIGVDYDNIKKVQEKRETGELPAENSGLPWGRWAIFPFLIEHKGEFYIRCTKGANNIPKVEFFLDSISVSKPDIESVLLASEKSSGDDNDVFNIRLNTIVNYSI